MISLPQKPILEELSNLVQTENESTLLDRFDSILRHLGIPLSIDYFAGLPLTVGDADLLRLILGRINKMQAEECDTHDIFYLRLANICWSIARSLKPEKGWVEGIRKAYLTVAKNYYLLLPSNDVAKRNLALLLLDRMELRDSLSMLDSALKKMPRDAQLWYGKGKALHLLGQYEEALRCLERGVEIEPREPILWLQKARVLADLELWKESLECYGEALALRESLEEAWREKGDILFKLGKEAEARFAHQKARSLHLHPLKKEAVDLPTTRVISTPSSPGEPEKASYPLYLDIDKSRETSVRALLAIEGVGIIKAESLYDKGFRSLHDLKEAKVEDLTKVRGISEKLARKIKEMAELEITKAKMSWREKRQRIEDLMESARNLLEEKQYKEALALYDEVTSIDEKNEKAWLNKGEIFHELNQIDDALKCYDRAIELNQEEPGTYMEKANALMDAGRPLEAVECHRKILSLNPANAEYLNERANILIEEGDYETAILCYNSILEADPENLSALLGIAHSLLEVGDIDEAEKFFDRASALDPKSEKAWLGKAHVLNRRGRWGAAIQFYDRAITLKWNDPEPWLGKGDIHLRQGSYREAAECFEKALESEPRNRRAWMGKVYSLQSMGKETEAKELLKDLLEIFPNFEEAKQLYLSLDKPKEAVASTQEKPMEAVRKAAQAIRLRPQEAGAWILLGDAFLELNRTKESLRQYDKAIQLDPKNALAYCRKGKALYDLGKHREALECVEKALFRDENLEEAKRLKMMCLKEMGGKEWK